MKDINAIYYNHFGIAFQWKNGTVKNHKKIQIVFRDTGFLLTKKELARFSNKIEHTIKENSVCNCCTKKEVCRSLLLETPVPQVSLAVSKNELSAIQDLIEGTLFQLNMDSYLDEICKKQ